MDIETNEQTAAELNVTNSEASFEVQSVEAGEEAPFSVTISDSAFNGDDSFPDFESFMDEPTENDGAESDEQEGKPNFLKTLAGSPYINSAIRILGGLVCLVFSLMSFVPDWVKVILTIASVALCGIPVFLNAVKDISNKHFISEYLIISVAAVFSALVGRPADAVLVLILADVGFTFRDNLIQWFSDEARLATEGAGFDNDEDVLEGRIRLVTMLFTPVMAGAAVLIALLSLIFGGESTAEWIHRALTVLVAACPIATIALSVLIYDFGKGKALKSGILFSDAKSINSAAGLTSVIFNKTGTVTDGTYMISGVYPIRLSDNQLLYLAAYAEAYSQHPLAAAIKSYAGVNVDMSRIERHREEKGSGNIVQLQGGIIVAVGNLELMERLGVKGDISPSPITSVYVAVGKTYVGRIDFEDHTKAGTREAVSKLRKEGISSVALITGDNTLSATRLGKEVGINEVYADCLPRDKYERIQYIAANQEPDDKLGIITWSESDIEAASLADLRIILGEAKQSPASVIIPEGKSELIPEALKIAKSVASKAKIGIILLFSAKAISVLFALLGIFNMFAVALLDTAVLLITALWAMFSFGDKKKKAK